MQDGTKVWEGPNTDIDHRTLVEKMTGEHWNTPDRFEVASTQHRSAGNDGKIRLRSNRLSFDGPPTNRRC